MIYIVEDDPSILKLVSYTLKQQGYQVVGFDDPLAFEASLDAKNAQLILLDIMLPKKDGLEVLKGLKQGVSTKKIPVILLTAKNSEFDKVMGLDLGADDYVAKPFGMMELLARIKALLRRTQNTVENVLIFHELVLNKDRHEVHVSGEKINLTRKEFDLLALLMEKPGHCFTREYILDTVWGYEQEGTRTVDVHIRLLRSKLNDAGKYIETVRSVGYRVNDHD